MREHSPGWLKHLSSLVQEMWDSDLQGPLQRGFPNFRHCGQRMVRSGCPQEPPRETTPPTICPAP